jgi:hypothetical protein
MLDNPMEVRELLHNMAAHLPIPAYATNALVRSLREREIKITSKRRVHIEKVLYFGDEGGIMCPITFPGEEDTAVVVSLTHLRVKSNHPLAKDIRGYQIKRVRNLAQRA